MSSRSLRLLLALSLLFNVIAGLAYFASRHRLPAVSHHLAPPPAPSAVASPPASASSSWQTRLAHTNLADWPTQLRAAGFPETVIRAIIIAEVDADLDRARIAAQSIAPNSLRWSPSDLNALLLHPYYNLYRQRHAQLNHLLGATGYLTDSDRRKFTQRYGPLSDDKLAALRDLELDYSEIKFSPTVAATRSRYSHTPSAAELTLQQEHLNDLAATLTPVELDDYLSRNTALGNAVRTTFSSVDLTPAEFGALFSFLYQRHIQENGFAPINQANLNILEQFESGAALVASLKDQIAPDHLTDIYDTIVASSVASHRFASAEKLPLTQSLALAEIELDFQKAQTADATLETIRAAQAAAQARLRELLPPEVLARYLASTYGYWTRPPKG